MKHRAYEKMRAAFAASDGGWLKRTDLALLLGRRYVGTITDVLVLNKLRREGFIEIAEIRRHGNEWFEYRRIR